MAVSSPSFWRSGAASAAFALAAVAQAASPTLSRIVPAGGQRGTEVEVVCEGTRLEDARGLVFYGRGLEVTGVAEAAAGKFKAKIKIAADAALGEHTVRVWTATGLGDARTFYVTPYPVVIASVPFNGRHSWRTMDRLTGTGTAAALSAKGMQYVKLLTGSFL